MMQTPTSAAPTARRDSLRASVGGVAVGGGAPIVVQSMTNTDTADITASVKQVAELARAGSEIVRLTVNNPESAVAARRIDMAVSKGVYHRRTGSRHISRLMKQAAAL